MKFAKFSILALLVVTLSGCTTLNTKKPPTASFINKDRAQTETVQTADVAKVRTASPREIYNAFNGGILPKVKTDKLSRNDKARLLLAEYRALENGKTGQVVPWTNPKGTASGKVTPAQPYQVGSQNCRQYSHDAIINGESVSASGAACRTADGKWVPLS